MDVQTERTQRKLSRRQLAELLACSQYRVWQLEVQGDPPTDAEVVALRRAFAASTEDVSAANEPETETVEVTQPDPDAQPRRPRGAAVTRAIVADVSGFCRTEEAVRERRAGSSTSPEGWHALCHVSTCTCVHHDHANNAHAFVKSAGASWRTCALCGENANDSIHEVETASL